MNLFKCPHTYSTVEDRARCAKPSARVSCEPEEETEEEHQAGVTVKEKKAEWALGQCREALRTGAQNRRAMEGYWCLARGHDDCGTLDIVAAFEAWMGLQEAKRGPVIQAWKSVALVGKVHWKWSRRDR